MNELNTLINKKVGDLHDVARTWRDMANNVKEKRSDDFYCITNFLKRALDSERFAAMLFLGVDKNEKDFEVSKLILFSDAISLAKELKDLESIEELKEFALADSSEEYKKMFLKEIGE